MSVPKFAYVRFLDDQECRVVRIAEDIKHFDPSNHHESKVYLVRRSLSGSASVDSDSGKENNEREDSIKQKVCSGPRFRMPNVDTAVEVDTGSSDVPCTSLVRMKRQLKDAKAARKDKSAQTSVTQDCQLSAITNGWRMGRGKDDFSSSMIPASQSQKQLEERPSQFQEQTKDEKIRRLKEERAALRQRVERLETLNFQLQEEIVALSKKARLSDRPDDAPTSPKQSQTPTFLRLGEAINNQLYTPIDGKVQLLGGIEIPEREWRIVNSQRTNSLFVKSLAVAIWGTATLRDRSVCGRVCPRFIHTGGIPPKAKPPLSPRKLNAVKACFTHHLHTQGLSAEAVTNEVKKMNNYITEKIQDLNRAEIWECV
ncbi:BEN domain-containing protein 5-like isoform X2 [Carcharodon carcharias]|uniref:BEN domain-containing protein 5-like isoform X2 n=1 Tax=Carcharodon carcharias TaxID=13397 RepID=UPI001B7D996C|nr:BEN domain-containing protein 5-like isoform X2 [Carcharodon carcharias]